MARIKVAIIGLGKMGEALAYRALNAKFEVFGFDINADNCAIAHQSGVTIVTSIADFAHKNINVFWLMIPQGELVDKVIMQLKPVLTIGDIIIDGGNSKFTDSIRRAKELALSDIFFIDCGTSGGVHGRENGFCLMIGGDKKAYDSIEPLLCALAAPGGYTYIGSSGTGHYVKMVHNGIEYGLLQAYAEGFHLLKDGVFKSEHLDLENIAQVWNHGSVIRSWILELVQDIMKEDQNLIDIEGNVASTGMGKWTVEQAHRSHIPVSVIEESLRIREESEKTGGNYATKIVAMLRNKFGGHSVTKKREI
ncbi:MAG TPA: decarboxylating 6-phosphogluconate dehydrogenase [Candidatus Babeliales bacterium]|nr:decarboxylating 6-phosphogluconate dehydrogenase [Candidatus Babeliales bacterium]